MQQIQSISNVFSVSNYKSLKNEFLYICLDHENNDQEVLTLSEQDSIAFIEALDNPPSPNENLLKAASGYREISGL